MIVYADVIVDLQYGDTGKGKVCLTLSKDYDICLRYNGGGNAGHTVYHNGQKVVLHQIPVGILNGLISIIGPGCVVDPNALAEEIKMLEGHGVNVSGLLKIDKRTHIVEPKHLLEDSSDTRIGTTRRGIGPAYRDKYNRSGLRVEQYKYLHKYMVDVIEDYWFGGEVPYRVLCEGAQGFHLDIDFGDYPYVTSSHCTTGSVCLNGIPPQKIRNVYGILKAYTTYVGNKDFEPNDPDLSKLRETGKEFGATTGRPRKCNWLDLRDVILASRVNGVTHYIINKLDILEEVGIFKLYDMDGILFSYDNVDEFKKDVEHELGKIITWSKSPTSI